jgi:hypothetical protein
VQQGTPSISTAALVGGQLVVQGRTSAQPTGAVGRVRQTSLNGTIQFVTLGLTLRVPLSMFEVQRALAWSYNTSLSGFTAPVTLTGYVTAVKVDTSSSRVDLVAGDINCTLSGEVSLFSSAYPGPGFNGTYGLARGSWLSLTPDPWAWFDIRPPAPAARHLLAAGSPRQQDQQQKLQDAGQVVQQVCADTTHHRAGGGQEQHGSAGTCTGHQDTICASSSSTSSHKEGTCQAPASARQLLQDTGSTTSRQPIQGRLTVAEPGIYYPNPTADAARGDKAAWLDDTGSISIKGTDQVPAELVPQWKKGGWGVKWVIPVWLWIAGAGGVLLLCVVGVGIWAIVAARRRRREEQQERARSVENLGLEPVVPGQPPGAWASRVTTPTPGRPSLDKVSVHSPRRPAHAAASPRSHPSRRHYPPSPRGPTARQRNSLNGAPDPYQQPHYYPSNLRRGSADRLPPGVRGDPWEPAAADIWVNEPQEPPWDRNHY